ncbi:replication protein A 70 kDa DNA-binding subunit A-like [Cryptomeria japonica]|uniref:replication protein A 70 kDa DNA-binding subunit A-like n=1 Tax=Cryptomeria japonica TaxID=3369 RepID=UPI0027DA6340|nr:replication protein A 70 kDa DNA-binding subunit A-like [Cryptomeria japonica]
MGNTPMTITPIKNLNPFQPRRIIKGRVLVKEDIYHYDTTKESEQVFSFDVVDSESTEIHVTCFNELAKTYYDNIQVGVTYTLSGEAIKPTNKIYNKLNSGLEITLVDDSKVIACNDDSSIPKHRFIFTTLDQVASKNNSSTIYVIGIVISVDLSSTIRRRDGTKVPRHTIKLVDMTRTTIYITLWGTMAEKEGTELQRRHYLQETTTLAIKSGCVCEFDGKVIRTTFNIGLFIDPPIEELTQLKDWFNQNVDIGQEIVHQLAAPTPSLKE